MIELAKIRTDGGTQSRAAINEETVAEYAEAMRDPNTVFPPVIVYYDGREYWLADGFHRVEAWREIGRVEVPAEVRQGDRRRAILHSCGANAAHGLRRSNADKRRAVQTLLEDAEWSEWSDRQISKQCGVSHTFVANLRREIFGEIIPESGNGCHSEAKSKADQETVTTFDSNENRAYNAETAEAVKPDQETPPNHADGAAKPEAFAEGTSGGGMEGAVPAPEPEPDPYGYAKLTEEALLDTANGLRADLDDAKARIRKQTGEIADFKAQIKTLTSDEDSGRKIGNLMRQLDQSKGRAAEHQANASRLQRQVNAQDAEIKKLRRELENQEVPL